MGKDIKWLDDTLYGANEHSSCLTDFNKIWKATINDTVFQEVDL